MLETSTASSLFHKCFHALLGEDATDMATHTHTHTHKTRKTKECKKCCVHSFWALLFSPLNPFFIITGTTGCQWWTGQWVSCSSACNIGRLVRSTCHGGHLWFLMFVYLDIYIYRLIYEDICILQLHIYIYINIWVNDDVTSCGMGLFLSKLFCQKFCIGCRCSQLHL